MVMITILVLSIIDFTPIKTYVLTFNVDFWLNVSSSIYVEQKTVVMPRQNNVT